MITPQPEQPRSGTSRRDFLRYSAMSSAAVTLPWILAACGSSAKENPGVAGGGTITFGTAVQDADGNPMKAQGHTLNYLAFDALTFINPNTKKVEPRLATAWSRVSPTVMDFTLRDNVKFSDGTAMTAEDVKFSFDVTATEKLSVASLLATIKSMEISSPNTIRVTTTGPDALLEKRLALLFIVPKAAYLAVGTDKFGLAPIGTGQYKITKVVPNSSVEFAAVKDSWRGVPKNDKVIEKMYGDASAFLAAIQSGQLDVGHDAPAQALKGLGNGIKVEKVSTGSPLVVQLDTKAAPFNNPAVRQALNMAVNVAGIVSTVMSGAGDPLPGQLAGKDCFGYNPDVSAFPYDLDKARSALARAGVGKVSTEIAGLETNRPVMEAISGELAKVGFTVKVTVLAFTEWVDAFNNGSKWPMFVKGLNYAPLFDAGLSYRYPTGGLPGRKSWIDSHYDDLFAASQSELDEAKREKILQEIGQYLHDQAPFIYLFGQEWVFTSAESVSGVNSATGFWFDASTVEKS